MLLALALQAILRPFMMWRPVEPAGTMSPQTRFPARTAGKKTNGAIYFNLVQRRQTGFPVAPRETAETREVSGGSEPGCAFGTPSPSHTCGEALDWHSSAAGSTDGPRSTGVPVSRHGGGTFALSCGTTRREALVSCGETTSWRAWEATGPERGQAFQSQFLVPSPINHVSQLALGFPVRLTPDGFRLIFGLGLFQKGGERVQRGFL